MADGALLPRPLNSDWEWQQDAACRAYPTEMFFHPDGERGPRRKKRIADAKAICASCPVLNQCREQALALHEPYGIWGGLSEEERTDLIAQRERQKRFAILRGDLISNSNISTSNVSSKNVSSKNSVLRSSSELRNSDLTQDRDAI
jgi:WhiB family transcriptional regulator, redox-sensing transcriptional regulator